MEIRNIEYFLHLAKFQHVSATADFLNISQPSLSKHIHTLERELGIQLFDRIGNRICLNKNGEQFALYAKQAMELLHAGVNSAKSGIYDTKGTIRIAYSSYAPILADCITRYAQMNPRIDFHIVALNEAMDMMSSNELDLLLNASTHGAIPAQRSDLFWVTQPLFQERYVLILGPETGRTLCSEPFDLTQLKGAHFVTMAQKDVFFTDITFSLCINAGFFPKVYCKTDEFIVKAKLVSQDFAVAFIPESCLGDAMALAPSLRYVEIDDRSAIRTINLARHRKALMSEAALDFWTFVLDYYDLPEDHRE